MNRILIIGLDGASPHLVRRWQDSLPHLGRMIKRGASGALGSSAPPRSIPAWYSLATGMNPAKIGVFGFSQRRPGTYDYTFANFTHCQAPPLWSWLGRRGIRSGVVHLPGTFPPQPLEGFMVSGWPAPLNRGDLEYTYPASGSREIDAFLGRPFEFVSPRELARDNEAVMLREHLRILRMHGDVAVDRLSRNPWQVGIVVLSPLDRASHQFWRHMDPAHPAHDPMLVGQHGAALRRVYEATDEHVGRLLSLLDPEDWALVVSDHGFGPVHRTFYLNEWLRREGYLVLREQGSSGLYGRLERFAGRLATPLFRWNETSPRFRRLTAPLKKRALSNFLRDGFVKAQEKGRVRLNHLPVDWSRTRAYCPDENSLYLNLRGRDPAGLVEPGREAEALLQELEEKLGGLEDPQTLRPLSVTVHRKEELYNGPYLSAAPELIVYMDDFRTEVMAELRPGLLFDDAPVRSGNHTPEGLLVAAGPGIPAGQRLDANLMDIAPTVLHVLGLPVPRVMDGRVLLDLFGPGSAPRRRAVRWDDHSASSPGDVKPYTEQEDAAIEKQLRDLGYLG